MTDIEVALAAIKRMESAEAAHFAARRDRNTAIRRAAAEGMTAPQIWRALDKRISLSLVRHILVVRDDP